MQIAHSLCLRGSLGIKGEAVCGEGIEEYLHNALLESVKFRLPYLTDGNVV